MRIQSDSLVPGFSAKRIGALLRHSEFLSVHDAMTLLRIRRRRAVQLHERLEAEGFIERIAALPEPETEPCWKRTIKGGALSIALFSAPVSRRTAEKELSEFMNRVHQVNTDSRFLYRDQKAVLFGSFLTDAPTVGDLDVAVELIPKELDGKKHSEMVLARAADAASNGRRFQNFVERISFPAQEVRQFLKSRSRIIQLTDCKDGVLEIAQSRVIYEYPEKGPPAAANHEAGEQSDPNGGIEIS